MQLRWVLLIIRTNKLLVRQSQILTSATFLICYCSAWNYKFILSLSLNHSMAGYISYIILHHHHDVWNCGEPSKRYLDYEIIQTKENQMVWIVCS